MKNLHQGWAVASLVLIALGVLGGTKEAQAQTEEVKVCPNKQEFDAPGIVPVPNGGTLYYQASEPSPGSVWDATVSNVELNPLYPSDPLIVTTIGDVPGVGGFLHVWNQTSTVTPGGSLSVRAGSSGSRVRHVVVTDPVIGFGTDSNDHLVTGTRCETSTSASYVIERVDLCYDGSNPSRLAVFDGQTPSSESYVTLPANRVLVGVHVGLSQGCESVPPQRHVDVIVKLSAPPGTVVPDYVLRSQELCAYVATHGGGGASWVLFPDPVLFIVHQTEEVSSVTIQGFSQGSDPTPHAKLDFLTCPQAP